MVLDLTLGRCIGPDGRLPLLWRPVERHQRATTWPSGRTHHGTGSGATAAAAPAAGAASGCMTTSGVTPPHHAVAPRRLEFLLHRRGARTYTLSSESACRVMARASASMPSPETRNGPTEGRERAPGDIISAAQRFRKADVQRAAVRVVSPRWTVGVCLRQSAVVQREPD